MGGVMHATGVETDAADPDLDGLLTEQYRDCETREEVVYILSTLPESLLELWFAMEILQRLPVCL
jgi:hypothetical protein